MAGEFQFASTERRGVAVVNSALWAAAGDAIGWITELSRGPDGVAYRSGVSRVREPIAWQRTIGGRGGPRVDLPAGTYSDDTQLRLSVCRSIRGDGSFDAESFAKIEMTVWPSYSLGGGLGTKAAATNLARRSVNWFSNFFDNGGQEYVNGGGNGAAMRVQPHVWSTRSDDGETLLLNVLRDALVTHGHPQGFCGAIFHAAALADTLANFEVPQPRNWHRFVDLFRSVPRLIDSDPQLSAFWRSAWEKSAGVSLHAAIERTIDDAHDDLRGVLADIESVGPRTYHTILTRLGCLSGRFRGAGFKTALAALALSHLYRHSNVGEALVEAANELNSDTDTIATMAGALLGAAAVSVPEWQIQDREYIIREAQRLNSIAESRPEDSFNYPDLSHWNPPATQNAALAKFKDGLAIAGLGQLSLKGPEYRSGDAVWQWCSLPFGQTILAKRRIDIVDEMDEAQLPGPRLRTRERSSNKRDNQTTLPFADSKNEQHRNNRVNLVKRKSETDFIDALSDEAIYSHFDNETIGRLFNECVDATQSVNAAIGFAAIVAKAKIARKRRNR